MSDLLSFPLPILLFLLGLFALFLSIGGTIAGSKAPVGKERLVGISGVLFVLSSIAIFIWQSGIDPGNPTATVAVITDTFTVQPEETHNTPSILTPMATQNATAVFPTQSTTAIPTEEDVETAVPTSTSTLNPTETSEPADTATPTPTSTATATATPNGLFEVQSTTADGTIYAGPGIDIRQALGVFQYQTVAEAIGRTQWNNWVEIKLETGLEGWVEVDKVEFMAGTIDGLPITWPPSGSGTGTGDGDSSGETGRCITVTVDEFDWPAHHFDDVTFSWSDWPEGTAQVKLSVWSTVEGEQRFVFPAAFSDLGTTTYTVGRWMFENEAFPPGLTYTYTVEPLNAEGGLICTASGTFEQ